jgi:hypothetical protein
MGSPSPLQRWRHHADELGMEVVLRTSRRAARRARRGIVAAFEHLSPAHLVPLGASLEPASVALLAVYRHENVPILRTLLAQLPPGAEVRLWALDRVHDDLAELTFGSGPGGRLDLLNTLAGGLAQSPEALVIADDDVEIVGGTLRRLVRAGSALGFDLFQSAHVAGSASAFSFTRVRPLSFARETLFVEQGPLVVVSRKAQRALLPFPSDLGMGWGIELRWWRAAKESGLRLGVVDAVSMRHFRGSQRTYDTGPEKARLRRELDAAGVKELGDLQRTIRSVDPLQAWRGLRQGRHSGRPMRHEAVRPNVVPHDVG